MCHGGKSIVGAVCEKDDAYDVLVLHLPTDGTSGGRVGAGVCVIGSHGADGDVSHCGETDHRRTVERKRKLRR